MFFLGLGGRAENKNWLEPIKIHVQQFRENVKSLLTSWSKDNKKIAKKPGLKQAGFQSYFDMKVILPKKIYFRLNSR